MTYVAPCISVLSVGLALLVTVILIAVLLIFCGVFQETKDYAEEHTTGRLVESYSLGPTATRYSRQFMLLPR